MDLADLTRETARTTPGSLNCPRRASICVQLLRYAATLPVSLQPLPGRALAQFFPLAVECHIRRIKLARSAMVFLGIRQRDVRVMQQRVDAVAIERT